MNESIDFVTHLDKDTEIPTRLNSKFSLSGAINKMEFFFVGKFEIKPISVYFVVQIDDYGMNDIPN